MESIIKECLECYLCEDLKEHKKCGKVWTLEEAVKEKAERLNKIINFKSKKI